jgi:DNA polymerase-3 subunit alpha
MRPFAHLHTHSHYSLLTALPKIPDLVAKAKENKMKALALTDNGNLYGAIEFYQECVSVDIKPIIGVDAYMALRTRFDKQSGVDSTRSRLVLLAKNEVGYKNLLELVTAGHLEGFYYKPRIDQDILKNHAEGLIAISPSVSGEIAKFLLGGEPEKAKNTATWYREVFGEDFFLEITKHPELQGHEEKMQTIINFARTENIPLVAAHDIFYLDPEDREARETLMSIQNHGERDRGSFDDEEDDSSFISQEEMRNRFADLPDALENVETVVNRINLTLDLGSWVFPDLKIENGNSYEEELRRLVYEGVPKRGLKKTEEIVTRIEYELSIIKEKGFFPYFLIVGDLLRHAHENGILTNIRGSVAGSMVTYLAGITDLNPIEYELPFERFLNPERPSAPDIDMDYADNRRDEMIEYVRSKYGAEKVAQIGTFGTMMARGAVRDIARAMGHPYGLGDRIAKMVPMGSQGFPMTLKRAFEIVPELKEAYEKEREVKEIIDMAKKIEGCARHISVHAAGVVISPTKLTDFTPVQFDTKGEGKVITQYDMYSVEEAGLLKFDFLGLKNLSIIADTLHRIEAIEGTTFNIGEIPLNDQKTFDLLARGDTEGLFQLNGDAMTKFLMDLKPSSIHDINAMVALYRPGPMQFIPDFIKRKHDHSLISYLDPALESILSRTYGILVYQDDLLMIAKDIAGYSWGELDKFRKAVGKKIPKEMAAQKEKFIKGCTTKSGWPEKKAKELWTWIEPFAAYGFNKAHSASYGRVAYQTAYLKANFPAIYMSAVLTADSGDVDKIGSFVAECKRMNIPVLPPSVNESFAGFTVVREPTGDKIRFGLTTIKNFGEGIARIIIEERKKNGRFLSLADFVYRVKDRNLNKKSLEALIKSGALDEFGERGNMAENLEKILECHREWMQEKHNQDSLFGLLGGDAAVPSIPLSPSKEATAEEKLLWEKELLGLYISGHPLDKHKEKIEKHGTPISKIKESPREGASVLVCGLVENVREISTKKNERMLFMRMGDKKESIEVVVFPRTLATNRELFVPDSCLAVFGKISKRNGEISLIAEKAKTL